MSDDERVYDDTSGRVFDRGGVYTETGRSGGTAASVQRRRCTNCIAYGRQASNDFLSTLADFLLDFLVRQKPQETGLFDLPTVAPLLYCALSTSGECVLQEANDLCLYPKSSGLLFQVHGCSRCLFTFAIYSCVELYSSYA